jgi:hypothetical protein
LTDVGEPQSAAGFAPAFLGDRVGQLGLAHVALLLVTILSADPGALKNVFKPRNPRAVGWTGERESFVRAATIVLLAASVKSGYTLMQKGWDGPHVRYEAAY